MKKIYFLALCSALLLGSCSGNEWEINEKLINEITNDHVRQMAEKYQACISMSGGNCNDGIINDIGIGFSKNSRASLEEARNQIIFQVEEYLQDINQSEKIRPFLADYPFNSKHLCYQVSFRSNEGKFQKMDPEDVYNSIASVLLYKGNLFYSYYDDPKYGLQRLHQEDYEDALEIVRKSGKLTSMEKQD